MRGEQTDRGQTLVSHLCGAGDLPPSHRLRGLGTVDPLSSLPGLSSLVLTGRFTTSWPTDISLEDGVKARPCFLLLRCLVIPLGVAGADVRAVFRIAVEGRVVALIVPLFPRFPLALLKTNVEGL